MAATVTIQDSQHLVEFVRQSGQDSPCVPLGGATKPALATSTQTVRRMDLRNWAGIVSYDPSEFLITAKSGTPIAELKEALGEFGQYLPFDPPYADEGATVGGTIAAGISGSNRLLFGGIRDFVMEVEMVDGAANLVRGGGKVVKNAAGFDLPKLIVGSCGRLGVLTEVTLKVLPAPQDTTTLISPPLEVVEAVKLMQMLLQHPLPIAAMDFCEDRSLAVRLAGPSEGLAGAVDRATKGGGDVEWMVAPADSEHWDEQWLHLAAGIESSSQSLVRIVCDRTSLERVYAALQSLDGVNILRTSGGGCEVWVRTQSEDAQSALGEALVDQQLPAIVVTGFCKEQPYLGNTEWMTPARRIQAASDPNGCFVPY